MYIMRYIKRNNLEISNEDAVKISEHFKLSLITSKFLLSRGYDVDSIDKLLRDGLEDITPNETLYNCDIASERIEEAMMVGEKIAVFGDYDADGICGTSIIINSFRSFGYDDIVYYIPHRISEGYGLNNDAIDLIAEQGCSLIITVDCGISNVDEIQYARDCGIDVLVTDHHLPGKDIPNCIVVNPKLSDDKDQHNLCGAAVALKLMSALFDEGVYYENSDLAAIATIADMVDLTGENRALVKMGLKKINDGSNPNIAYLVKECIKAKKEIKADDISFSIAPAINAAGRIDAADKCVELFTGKSSDPQETAAILAHDNFNRQRIEKETFLSATEKIKDLDLSKTKSIILYDDSWHQGVLGIAASKIKNKYHRPVILFTKNEDALVGSARSIDGIDIHGAIEGCSEYVSHFGGHFMAAGLSLEPENLKKFVVKFEDCLKEYKNEVFLPKIEYDVVIDTDEITLDLIEELEKIEPYGKGIHAPVFLAKSVTVSDYSKIGTDKNHFRCKIIGSTKQIPSVAFSNYLELDENLRYDAIISIQKNEWNNRVSVQSVMRDVKLSEEGLNKHLLNQKEFFLLSASQGLYGGEGDGHNKSNYRNLEDHLINCPFSTLILAIDEDSVAILKNNMPDKFNELDLRMRYIEDGKINFNTLVIAPDFERLNFMSYDNIFIISKFDITKMFNSLRTKGKVYIISDYKKRTNFFTLDKDRLREIFVGMKQAISRGKISEFINGNDKIVLWEARAALRIFRESGLVKYSINEEKIVLTDKNKADITKSKTFIMMQAGK